MIYISQISSVWCMLLRYKIMCSVLYKDTYVWCIIQRYTCEVYYTKIHMCSVFTKIHMFIQSCKLIMFMMMNVYMARMLLFNGMEPSINDFVILSLIVIHLRFFLHSPLSKDSFTFSHPSFVKSFLHIQPSSLC